MKKYILAAFVALIAFSPVNFASAAGASLYLSPTTRSYDLGATFTMTIYVNASESINAAAGTLSFSEDKLQVVSLSKTGSIFSLWAQEPAFSNTAGTVSFEGVVLNPGYTGSAGKLLAVTFRTKAAGTAVVRFTTGSVLANNGEGTNVLTSMGSAEYEIGDTGPVAPSGTTVNEVISTPGAPAVSSVTHPDSTKWYSAKTASFSWSVPSGVTGVRTLASQSASSLPTILSAPPVSSREVKDLTDGTWYFHLQFRNENGWGAVSHFRFQIDSENPEKFNLTRVSSADPNLPTASFSVDAADKTSGIDYYEVQIDNQAASVWRDSGSHVYTTPNLAPGRHVIMMKAFDKAGNSLSAFSDFEIEGISPPVITDYPKEMYADTLLAIRGTSVANGFVDVRSDWNGEMKTQRVSVDAEGKFTFVFDEKLKEGAYEFSFKAVSPEGKESVFGDPITVGVRTPLLSKVGAWLVDSLTLAIVIAACVLLLAILGNRLLHHMKLFHKNVKHAMNGIETEVHQIFSNLRNDVEHALRFLNHIRTKRELTDEEEKLRAHLERSLDEAEKEIRKEVRDIAKKIK